MFYTLSKEFQRLKGKLKAGYYSTASYSHSFYSYTAYIYCQSKYKKNFVKKLPSPYPPAQQKQINFQHAFKLIMLEYKYLASTFPYLLINYEFSIVKSRTKRQNQYLNILSTLMFKYHDTLSSNIYPSSLNNTSAYSSQNYSMNDYSFITDVYYTYDAFQFWFWI